MNLSHLSSGKILAIDYGFKKIGLAITDPDRSIVFPREVLQRQNDQQLADLLLRYIKDHSVSLIVLGIPFHEDQTPNPMTQRIKSFGTLLEKTISIPLVFQNENFTSAEAEMMLQELGMSPAEQRKHRDVLSAMIILRSYLSAL